MHIELSLAEAKSGEWAIENFYQNEIRYQRLTKNGVDMMLNTPEIVAEYVNFFKQAEGSVLVNGLGIGLCCEYLLKKDTITDLTLIEYEKDAIQLVAPHFNHDKRCSIIHADAFTYEPPKGKIYDYVWHDIWTTYASKNLKEMDILFAKYSKIAKWQGAWNQHRCLELYKRENSAKQ